VTSPSLGRLRLRRRPRLEDIRVSEGSVSEVDGRLRAELTFSDGVVYVPKGTPKVMVYLACLMNSTTL